MKIVTIQSVCYENKFTCNEHLKQYVYNEATVSARDEKNICNFKC